MGGRACDVPSQSLAVASLRPRKKTHRQRLHLPSPLNDVLPRLDVRRHLRPVLDRVRLGEVADGVAEGNVLLELGEVV